MYAPLPPQPKRPFPGFKPMTYKKGHKAATLLLCQNYLYVYMNSKGLIISFYHLSELVPVNNPAMSLMD